MGNVVCTQLKSSDGEVLVTIDLNITLKLDKDGELAVVSASAKPAKSVVKFEKPDMEDNSEIINFGKQV